MKTSDLEYELPAARIAVTPAEPRDSAKLLVVSRSDDSRVEHRSINDLPELLVSGDLMVYNTTRVLRARLVGTRSDTGGRVEGLYLSHAPTPMSQDRERWVVLLKGKRLRAGVVVELTGQLSDETNGESALGTVRLRLISSPSDQPGAWVVEVGSVPDGSGPPLERVGRTPLPPYILKARKDAGMLIDDSVDRARYQTTYAGVGESVAAPTAGLHFTPALLERLTARGVGRADIRLDVGTGTFRPVETENVEDHPMHSEWCEIGVGSARVVREAREGGRRVIAVGTTSARTLEAFAGNIESGADPSPLRGATRVLITPGHRWRCVDGMVTNFHLPRSTLLAMVGALFPGGVERVKELYRIAIEREYRFYSYGDAMLILP